LRDSLERRSADYRGADPSDGTPVRLVPGEHDRFVVPGPEEIQ
jgi:hypothetical protein